MPLFLVKNTRCFDEPERPHFGMAGAAYIAAVVTADDAEGAVAAMLDDMDPAEREYHNTLVAEPLQASSTPTVHLLVYGDY